MTQAHPRQPIGWVTLAAKAFILASAVAVFLPMPEYALSLGNAQFIVWVVRLTWVLLLSVGWVFVLLLVGFLKGRLRPQRKRRQ
ncbi:hypothetical protein [Desulfosarcina sp.]|uniref:hypothetical protein n=1 Tax=Desulfosarcina sp. TaxID=2027861 RepID=UPI003970C47D